MKDGIRSSHRGLGSFQVPFQAGHRIFVYLLLEHTYMYTHMELCLLQAEHRINCRNNTKDAFTP